MTTAFYSHQRDFTWQSKGAGSEVASFHRRLPDYAPTRLLELPELAQSLGVARVFAKDETLRLGLPAFKALGASWAVHRALEKFGHGITVVTATDGNHGRAIARFCRIAQLPAVIFVPHGVHPAAIAAIKAEQAEVHLVDDVYDVAVAQAANFANQPGHVLIQDTSWLGYEEIPGWIVEGYKTLFSELDEQLGSAGVAGNTVLVVPTGVGSLLQAAVNHYRASGSGQSMMLVAVEPAVAACIYESLRFGKPITVPTGTTIMAGLNCGTPSYLAWPVIQKGVDGAVVVSETQALDSLAHLRKLKIDAGPCAAAGLAALKVLTSSSQSREHLGIDSNANLVFLLTESALANPFA